MKSPSLDSATAATIMLLGCALVHCSAEPEALGTGAGGAGMVAGGAAGTLTTAGVASTAGSVMLTGSGGGSASTTDAGTTNGGSAASGAGGTPAIAGSGGSSAGAAAAGACAEGGIICEDFEQYPPDSAPGGNWTASLRGNGKIVVDATRAASGKQSLHVTGRMNADRANISQPIQADSTTVYVRFMLYAASYPASSGVHTRLMRIGTSQAASGDPETSYSLANYNGTGIEKVNSIYLRDTGTKLNDPSTLNRWRCWEFSVDKSGGVGKVKVQIWVDGRELKLSVAGSASHGMTSPSWDPIPFELFMLGLDGFQPDEQPADFWIDDLSVTPQRVGCKVTP